LKNVTTPKINKQKRINKLNTYPILYNPNVKNVAMNGYLLKK